MNISIVIPNFNGKDLLAKNLPKVVEAKNNKKNNVKEIIVVDDGSTDDSLYFIKKNFSRSIKLIVHKVNRGFATSINTGVKMANGDLVCLLNTDVIPSMDFLETMAEDFEDPIVFAVSLHEKGYGYAEGKFKKGFIVHEGKTESKRVEETFWASGGSSVLRKEVFRELRGMDDELLSPYYWEDIDLSYRAQKRGYIVLWDPRAKVIHEHESTVRKLDQIMVARIRERNQLLFVWKNLTSSNLLRRHLIELFKKTIRHPGYLRIVLMARKKWGKLIELRKREIKESRVSDEAIFGRFN